MNGHHNLRYYMSKAWHEVAVAAAGGHRPGRPLLQSGWSCHRGTSCRGWGAQPIPDLLSPFPGWELRESFHWSNLKQRRHWEPAGSPVGAPRQPCLGGQDQKCRGGRLHPAACAASSRCGSARPCPGGSGLEAWERSHHCSIPSETRSHHRA